MKVLFLFWEGFDIPGPSNHLMKALVEDTLNAGYGVYVIESRRDSGNASIPGEWRNIGGLSVFTVRRRTIPKDRFISRYLELVRYAFRARRVWKKIKDADIAYVQSCPAAVFPIVMLRYGLDVKMIYNIQDMFPGSAIASGVMKNSVLQKIFRLIQKAAYKYSDIITVISEDMKQKVIEQGVPEHKIRVIVNWYDDQTVHEVLWPENRFVAKYGLSKDTFYIQYAGTMGYVFDYNMVLDAAEKLRGYKDIVFQMIGNGSQKQAFINAARERELGNIVFYPLEPQDMVSDVYSACSVCFIPLKPGIIGNSVPSKAGLLMACNRTIVNSVDEDSAYYRTFNENEIGISVSNRSPDEAVKALIGLYEDPEKREFYAKNAKAYGEKYYSRKVNTERYISLFSELAGNR